MAKTIKANCCSNNCTAMPITRQQYYRILGVLHNGTAQDVAYTNQVLNMEYIICYCKRRNEIVMAVV